MEENSHREKFDHESKTLDFRNLIPSDIKINPRVQLPKPRSDREERELSTRKTMVLKEVREYLARVEQVQDSLTKSEHRGFRKKKKRVEAQEIVILETDKSSKLCIMSVEM